MPKKPKPEQDLPDTAAMHLRGIPLDLFYKFKAAAALERKSARDLMLELIETKIAELEKKGVLPKGK